MCITRKIGELNPAVKTIAIIVGAIVATGIFAASLQTKAEAASAHAAINARVDEQEARLDDLKATANRIERDVQVIRCVVVATSAKHKARCALGQHR